MPGRPLTLPQVADKLGVHYMTAYRYVRTGRLPARRVGGAWQVDSGDLAHVQRSRHGPRSPRATGRAPSPTRLEARLVAGDEAGAWDVLEASLASGMEPGEVLLDLVGPALRSIGTLWEHGKLSVADEHRASNLAARLISRLGARFARRGQKRGTVIVAAAPGERHGLPVAIAANLLRWRGFDVVELGADTPADSLAQAAAGEPDLVAVGIACTVGSSSQAARRAIAAVRRSAPQVPVLLGGAAIVDAAHARRLGADMFTGRRADEVVRAVEAVVADKPRGSRRRQG
ncbi:MAG: B12-binding domain-containing protein [Acidimicrobiales bacterium]|jgi:excisionase family DNA binding protein